MSNKENVWASAEELNGNLDSKSSQEFFELPVLNEIAQQDVEEKSSTSNRRDFLKYLGFGLGAATLAASCKSPIKKAIPYVVKPDAIVPGVATYYASSFVKGGDYCSVLVKNRDGRPIKIEGNGLSSITQGGTSARAQAAVLDLYDSNRLKNPSTVANGVAKATTWEAVDKTIASKLKADSKIRIVTNTILSPSTKQLFASLSSKYSNLEVVTYDPISASALLDANEASFGKRVVPSYDFSASVIVSFDADFLGTWVSPVEYSVAYAAGRKPAQGKMSRHYQVESSMSLTGSNADNRILVRPSEQGLAIAVLHDAIAAQLGGSAIGAKGSFNNAKAAKQLKELAKDLISNKSKGKSSVVVASSNNKAEQVLVNKINQLLGNVGKTVSFASFSNQRAGNDSAMTAFVKELNSGTVDAVFFNEANPVFDYYNAEAIKAGLAKTALKVSFNSSLDETTSLCDLALPNHNTLEAWDDAEPKAGNYGLVQPTIAPLFDTRASQQTFLNLIEGGEYVDYVKSYWETTIFPTQSRYVSFQSFWDNVLHDGVFDNSSKTSDVVYTDVAVTAGQISKPSSSAIEVSFFETVQLGTGQYAGNPWLQEMPDPITRCVWDNHLLVSLKWDGINNYDGFNDLKSGDVVDVTINGQTFEMPVVLQFGQQEGTCAIALGYGRTNAGKVGTGIGENVLPFVTDVNGTPQYFATDVTISKKKSAVADKEKEIFACVQHHHTLGVTGEDKENGNVEINVDEKILGYKGFQGSLTNRSIIETANLPELGTKIEELKEQRAQYQYLNSATLYKKRVDEVSESVAKLDKDQEKLLNGDHYKYETVHADTYAMGHHWGMNVDLSSCTGCGACQVACVAENNVPVVGKEEVQLHHEMTWLRIDRYYYGDVENPNVVYQPMMCQHCDNAPCENVCPVAATNHSSEGLNQMTYNRCIGTRYCANNCPYKVRRLNWYDYTTADLFPWNETNKVGNETGYYADDLVRMVLNPDVTVRSRGVIEKCSFCVQRLQEAKLKAKVESRRLRDGEANVACATACASGCITFGDMNDKGSQVYAKNTDDRNYKVLEEVNTQSSVGYLMKVTNKNINLEA